VTCNRARSLAVVAFLILPLAGAHGQEADEATSYPTRCGVGAALSERGRYVTLPRGDVFCPLIADPKGVRSFASYQRGTTSDFPSDIGAVGVADQYAFFRAGGNRHGNGIQLGIAGAVFAQFDLNAASYDLLNSDFIIALPLTFRTGGFSGRLRVYHQSSHLGDELLLRPEPPERENLSFEAAELLLSMDVNALRVYGGGEYFFKRDPITLPQNLLHGGVELRPRVRTTFGPLAVARPVAAVDVKMVNDSTWQTGVSVRAGFEFGRPRETEQFARRWSLLGEFYDGPSPYGQFRRDKVRLAGVGFHFTL
jgi:hypothetical protein